MAPFLFWHAPLRPRPPARHEWFPNLSAGAARVRLRVLLVDDEELGRLCTADVLVDLGYDVIEAASGEQALRLLDEGPAPDVLVTDYLMPGMSGADLAQAVRARKPGLPILIVFGYANPDGIAPDLSRLRKPFRSAELAQSIANLVRQEVGGGA